MTAMAGVASAAVLAAGVGQSAPPALIQAGHDAVRQVAEVRSALADLARQSVTLTAGGPEAEAVWPPGRTPPGLQAAPEPGEYTVQDPNVAADRFYMEHPQDRMRDQANKWAATGAVVGGAIGTGLGAVTGSVIGGATAAGATAAVTTLPAVIVGTTVGGIIGLAIGGLAGAAIGCGIGALFGLMAGPIGALIGCWVGGAIGLGVGMAIGGTTGVILGGVTGAVLTAPLVYTAGALGALGGAVVGGGVGLLVGAGFGAVTGAFAGWADAYDRTLRDERAAQQAQIESGRATRALPTPVAAVVNDAAHDVPGVAGAISVGADMLDKAPALIDETVTAGQKLVDDTVTAGQHVVSGFVADPVKAVSNPVAAVNDALAPVVAPDAGPGDTAPNVVADMVQMIPAPITEAAGQIGIELPRV
ncbi:hypothetical protein ACWIGW_16485 [Nocardia brasiliensis]